MRPTLLKILFVVFGVITTSVLKSQTSNNSIKVNILKVEEKTIAQISVENSVELVGLLKIVNSEKLVVLQLDQIELIKSPFYFSLDISEIVKGIYSVQIISSKENYSETIQIQ